MAGVSISVWILASGTPSIAESTFAKNFEYPKYTPPPNINTVVILIPIFIKSFFLSGLAGAGDVSSRLSPPLSVPNVYKGLSACFGAASSVCAGPDSCSGSIFSLVGAADGFSNSAKSAFASTFSESASSSSLQPFFASSILPSFFQVLIWFKASIIAGFCPWIVSIIL
ncbi:MAG: hypothetical protein ACD_65C00230G0001 [uncultured bacterium]|nr:MAG: hypothetical protein ACD_65C00230G0001 [uncultured bacterium]